MAILRESQKLADPSTRSDNQEQSSLATFLTLYSRTTNGAYCRDYMKGAEYLLRWLTPVGWIGSKQGCPLLLPDTKLWRVPDLLVSYDILELAKLITNSYAPMSVDFERYMAELGKIKSAIYTTMIDLINKEVL